MKTNKTKIILVVLLLVVVASVVANVFWFSFIGSEAQKIADINKEIIKEESQTYNPVELRDRIIALEERNASLNSIFVDRANIPAFIERVETMAASGNLSLQIQSVDVDIATQGDNPKGRELYGVLDMFLQISGSWSNVMEFVDNLQSQPNHISINSIRLQANSSGAVGATGSWTARIALSAITN